MFFLALLAIGLSAGALTTLCGVGGALIAVSATSLLVSARQALAISAAALLAGSLHRTWVYRAAIDRPVARRLGAGLLTGALLGAMVARHLPEPVLRAALIAISAAALLAAALPARRRPAPRWLAASGLLIGVLGASAGGAALLIAPILQAAGLRADRYAATGAAAATLFNASRCAGYAFTGFYDVSNRLQLAGIAVLAVACIAGNIVGARLRNACSPGLLRLLELAAPPLAIAMVLAGG